MGGFQFDKEHNGTKTHNRGDDLTLKIRWPKSRTNEPIWGRCAATAGSREWGPLGESRGDREQSSGREAGTAQSCWKGQDFFECFYVIFAQLCSFLWADTFKNPTSEGGPMGMYVIVSKGQRQILIFIIVLLFFVCFYFGLFLSYYLSSETWYFKNLVLKWNEFFILLFLLYFFYLQTTLANLSVEIL